MLLFSALIEHPENRILFEQLYQDYRTAMYRIAYSVLHDEQLAEDAVANAYFSVARNIEKISARSGKEQRSLLVIIVRNAAIDLYRKRAGEALPVEEEGQSAAAENTVLDALGYERLVRAIGGLKPIHRDVLQLRYLYEHSITETARLLNVTEGTVHARLTRARAALATALQKEGVDLP